MRLSLIVLLLVISRSIFAQLAGHSFLADDNAVLLEMKQQTNAHKKALMERFSKEDRKLYQSYYDYGYEHIIKFWDSEKPVTDAKYQAYKNKIVAEIVNNNPELKPLQINVVFSRNIYFNAASYGDGTIELNAGMVKELTNEAELAFILCHEIAHYFLKHREKQVAKIVASENDEEFKAKLKNINQQEYNKNKDLSILAKRMAFNILKHSREYELEADRYALKFIKNTSYSLSAIFTALNKMAILEDTEKKEKLSVDSIFNFKDYPFRKDWIYKESQIFADMTDNGDYNVNEKEQLKTHPDCAKRIEALTAEINGIVATSRKEFVVDADFFNTAKKNLLHETIYFLWKKRALSRQIYLSLRSIKENEEPHLHQLLILKSFNLLFDLRKAHSAGTTIDDEDSQFSEGYNMLVRMLSSLSLKEISSISFNWALQQEAALKDFPDFRLEMDIAVKNLKKQ